jgi:phosphate transport system permease protein
MDSDILTKKNKGSFSPKEKRDFIEKIIEIILFICAFSSVAITLAIIGLLLFEAGTFFQKISIVQFFTDTEWSPLFANPRYGVLPLICGTLVTTVVALAVAIPLGTIAAIYLSEFANPKVAEIVKPILELLAGVPTVVYGYFAFLFVTPLLQSIIPGLPGFNMLSAGLVMGIMIIPYVSSLSEDAMRAVPVYLREGSFAVGSTRLQTTINVVLPSAISGLSAAYILGISRAVGETMIVAVAAGGQPKFTLNPMEAAQSITAYIVSISQGDLPHGSIGYQSIFAVGLTLVVITLGFNILGYWLKQKYREVY